LEPNKGLKKKEENKEEKVEKGQTNQSHNKS
jgi:hypothetical protein